MRLILTSIRYFKSKFLILSAKYRRWKLALTQNIYVPQSTFIGPDCKISCSGSKIEIGENSTLVSNITLDGPITIGKNVIIAAHSTLIARSHDFHQGDALPYGTAYVLKPIVIKDNVWIGSNVSIIPGVCVGEGAVIGLGSVVTHDVPSCACVGGNPAKIIGWRNKDHYSRLVAEQKYLNNIRGSLIFQNKFIKKNNEQFKKSLQEKGFMLSCEIIGVNNIFQSYVLYNLHMNKPGTKFGNAGRFHVVLNPPVIEDIDKLAAEISRTIGEDESKDIEEVILHDITRLLELNE
jgi:maltose O-acetyltransferase